jgi:cation-transporting P-type ATPase F
MIVREIWAGNAHYLVKPEAIQLAGLPATVGWALKEVLVAGALCNNGIDPIELALLDAARIGRLHEPTLREVFPWLAEIVATPQQPVMATLHETAGTQVIYARGPIDVILPACTDMLDTHGRQWPLAIDDVTERTAALAAQGLHVVALARKRLDRTQLAPEDLHSGLTLVGTVGLTA